QFWKNIGANMEIEQIDQATFPPRAFQRKFDIIGWRIVDFPDPDVQMFANFYSKSPLNLANFTDPELDKLLEHARVTADEAKRSEDYCAVSRILNKQATWFWTFQNTYYAIAKAKVKGIPKLYSGVIDVSDAWLE
ncbi:MAG: ABC transporter substrate-binding protein, partial [Reyranellales bacterium]